MTCFVRRLRVIQLLLALLAIAIQPGCRSSGADSDHASRAGRQDVVIWISLDGFRRDYVDRDRNRLPTFVKLMRQGAYTRELVPVFPSLTFPSHVSEATGVPPDQHGIISNAFYDSQFRERYSFPTTAAIMQAEPIWLTASRQNVRTAVIDWPVSYEQTGPVRSDYFAEKYTSNKDANDAQRLDRILQIWQDDNPAEHGNRSLRLLMAYLPSIDETGHKFGPDAPETRDAVVAVDLLLKKFIDRAGAIFNANTRDPSARLYLVITTDHGMSPVHTQVNMQRVLGDSLSDGLMVITAGNIANVYLSDVPESDRAARSAAVVAKLREQPFIQAWEKQNLPVKWRYTHATRTGDVVAVLKPGYTWTSRREAVTRPSSAGGALGMHGYAPEDDPNMLGFAVIAPLQAEVKGIGNLGRIDSLRLHPTVAKLLGIDPAPGAKEAAIELTSGRRKH